MKKDNFVIEVLDLEHGQKVKKYFESLGIDVEGFDFCCTEKFKDSCRYYGIVNSVFSSYQKEQILPYVEIVTLPEQETEKTLEEKIKELALSENKVIKKLVIEDAPNIKWCLVWYKDGLKPNIVHIDCVGGYDNIIPLPDNMNEFINKNFMMRWKY